MGNLLARARRWWKLDGLARVPAVPYQIACACGQVARGQRKPRHQVVRCAACGAPVFVLPLSPLLLPAAKAAESHPAPSAKAGPARRAPIWVWPLLGAVVTLAFVITAYAVLLHALVGQPQPPGPPGPEDPSAQVRLGEQALAGGNFRRAADELTAACRLLEKRPKEVPAAEARRVAQLRRQAALLADLLSEPLEELLMVARRSPEDEWQAQFERRYEGHAVIFDADVTREGRGRYRLHYALGAGPERARIQVSDLRLLDMLPPDRPPRLLFGARLAGLRREAGGTWVVRFDPDSGVLLTDLGAVTACCPPPIDEDVKRLLEHQGQWLDDVP